MGETSRRTDEEKTRDTETDDQTVDVYRPEIGDAVLGALDNGVGGVVVEHSPQPAGSVILRGRTLADRMGVDAARAVVWIARFDDLRACHLRITSPRDAINAVRVDAVVAIPVPITILDEADEETVAEVFGG